MCAMKNKWMLSLLVVFFTSTQHTLLAQKIEVMSYNIRLDIPSDGENSWHHRKQGMANLLNYYQPEIFGLQEALPSQLHYIDSSLVEYRFIGEGRDGGNSGEACPIFYKKNKFKLIEQGTFWLSESPTKPSLGWDAAYKRICTYGLFENKKTKRKIWIFNTHFDNQGAVAREKSAQLLSSKIKNLVADETPIIVMGDLNCEPSSKPVKILAENFKQASEIGTYGPIGTFTGFDLNTIPVEIIDHMFVSNLQVLSYAHIDDRLKNNRRISDHLPVMLKANIKP